MATVLHLDIFINQKLTLFYLPLPNTKEIRELICGINSFCLRKTSITTSVEYHGEFSFDKIIYNCFPLLQMMQICKKNQQAKDISQKFVAFLGLIELLNNLFITIM